MNQIVTQNGLDPKIIESLVLGGDVGKLTPAQKVQYVGYRCKQLGLDPAAQPFQLLKLQGKEVLYATAAATQQLCQSRGLSVQITKREKIEDIYCVEARVTDKEGRYTENMGSTPLGGLKGEALSNALLKATTKAIRRTVLAHCGLGVMDETEVETIPDARPQRGNPLRKEFQGYSYEIEGCKSQEQIDLILESPEFVEFARESEAQFQRGGIDFADQLKQQAATKRKTLPERIMRDEPLDSRRGHETVDARPFNPMHEQDGGNEPVMAPAAPSQGDEMRASPPEPFTLGETASRILDMIDIAETADDMQAVVDAATKAKNGGELTKEEADMIQKAYRARRIKIKEAA